MNTLARLAALVLLALLGACSSFPRIVPDMAQSRATPQLAGARGPLSAARSKEILDGLRASNPDADILGRHLALETALSDSPLVVGNRVRLLQDGPATYSAMLDAIAAARDHINMETYIMEDDEAGKRFAAALIDKQRQGVQVNLIRDSVGTLGTPKEFFKNLSDAGVNVLEFNPVNPLVASAGWDVNQRDHRKLLVIDGAKAFLGGVNISSVYSGGSSAHRAAPDQPGHVPWRDTDLAIDGPVVASFQKLFVETWEKQKGSPLASRNYFPALARQGDEVVHAIGGSPDEPYNLIYATLISAIDASEKEVLLTNAYFVPDPQLVDALKRAVGRGVDVKVVLPSTTDSALVLNASHSHYDELLRAGIKIYERQNALLHAKTALIDGVWSTVGSTNLDWRSFLHNQEVTAVVLGTDFGTQMHGAFDADMAASREVTLAAWERRSPVQRLKEAFGRLWQYWL
ncbi:MAG: phospholipase D-like domain-containing protein [Pseudomonadota bacterium]|nr:phospholipase D-like domain-containing protein [Pseudomonadota bacterium]